MSLSKDGVSVRQFKELVKFMRDNGVAEFSLGDATVKFAFARHAPTPVEHEKSNEKFEEFQRSLKTHLDGRTPSQVQEDEEKDLFWSAR